MEPRFNEKFLKHPTSVKIVLKCTRMWANAQHHGRPAEYKWRPLFKAAKFG